MKSLKFNRSIYSLNAIRKAVSAYAHLARFTIRPGKFYTQVRIAAYPQKGFFCDEFSNFVLGMTIK